MAQKYIPVMERIKRAHDMKNVLPCIKFNYSINPYLGFWYAEDKLYIVHDCMVDAIYFQIANSPLDAIEKIIKRIEDANNAGSFVEEELE